MIETSWDFVIWLRADSALHPRTLQDRLDDIYYGTPSGPAYEMVVNEKLRKWRDAEVKQHVCDPEACCRFCNRHNPVVHRNCILR